MTARRVHYEGRVQGVGFRFGVKSLAREFDVAGSVRNLADGRVELTAQAADLAEITDFLEAIRASHLAGHIRGEEIAEIPADPQIRGFKIA